MNGGVRCGAHGIENQEHLVTLDQSLSLLDRLGRRVTVVIRKEYDLAVVDAALLIDLLEVSPLGLRDHAEGRCWSTIWRCVSYLDLSVGDARPVSLVRGLERLA